MAEPKTEKEASWYSKKELFEMMQQLAKELVNVKTDFTKIFQELSVEMKETKTLIRDYNGLRKRLDYCEQKLMTQAATDEAERKANEKAESKVYDLNAKNITLAMFVASTIIAIMNTLIPYIFKALKALVAVS